jgi:TPR repeat protein/transglutaminase-like putative cysteine protease
MRSSLVIFSLLTFLNSAFAVQPQRTLPIITGKSAFLRSTGLPKWAEPLEPVPATVSNEPVVLRLAEVQYWAGATPAHLVNRAIQVNSSSKLSELGQFSVSFVPAYEKLVVHRIAILRDNQVLDRTMSANVRVLDSENQVAQGYYTGTATAQVLLEDVKPGDTLWTIYSIEGSNPVFGSTWREQLPWTKDLPIELRKATVLYPSNKRVQWKFSGVERSGLQKPVVEQRNGVTKLVFRENGLAAEEFEPSLPPNLVPLPVLDFSEYRDWSEVAQWANKLFPNSPAVPEVRALAQKFSDGSNEQRASQALHWIQEEIRYFSVSMGENSHRPQSPEVVLKQRFGDCKDKSLLLVSLYRAMGLQAQAILVNSGSPKLPAQFLPSPGYFNHVIVRVVLDGKPYFVDPTLQGERGIISTLAAPAPGAAALVVSSDTTDLITLPEELMDEPLVDRMEQISIPQLHGAGQLKLHLGYRGRYAVAMRQLYRSLSSNELRKVILGQYERTYPDIQLDGLPKLSDGENGSSFVIDAQLTVPKILKEENGSFQLAQRSHVMEGTLGLPEKVVRKYPFWMPAGRYRARYTLDVSLPNEARMMKSDDRLELKNNFFVANSQLTWRGAQLNYYIDYVIHAPEVPPAEMTNLVQEVDKLSPLIESKLRFKAVTASPEAAKAASLRVLDILEKVSSFEDMQIEVLKTGKVPEFKFEESTYAKLNYRALCELTLDAYSVRNWNPLIGAPMAALYTLVDTHADKRTKDLCAARMELMDRSLPSVSKSLAKLVPSNGDPLTLMQAWADFHANDFPASRSNLARFLKAKASDGLLTVEDVVLAAALSRRLGMQEASEVTQVVDSLRSAVWPMPLFHFLRGRVTSDELLDSVEGLPIAAREQAALEAHFLIAQQDLAAQQKKQAAFHLNWLVRYGIMGSAFSILADADKYGEARADPDMQAVWKLERDGSKSGAIIEHLSKAADKGIAVAQSKLGTRYMDGDGVRRDFAKAQQLLEAAADMGDNNAINDLGVLFHQTEWSGRDEPRAVGYFQKAVENGNKTSGLNLGRAYLFGNYGLPIDYDLAFKHMMVAAELEETEAQFFVSRMYFEGKGVEKNDSLAKFWAAQSHFRKRKVGTAQLGLMIYLLETDPTVRQKGLEMLATKAVDNICFAQQEFGKLLLEGVGLEPNPGQAIKWIREAHECEFDSASALLGRMYIEGIGVSADVSRGMKMLTDMEKKNSPDALYQLGRVYRRDKGPLTDKFKAADYFRRGAELGQREAAEELAIMLHIGEGTPQDKPKAAQYYEIAIKSGFPRALNNLASMYLDGDGVPQDTSRAMALFRRASKVGHSMAMLSLAEIYEKNQQGIENSLLPLAYYMLAARFGEDEAKAGLERVKARSDQTTVDKAQAYVAAWKPGKAMPEEI